MLHPTRALALALALAAPLAGCPGNTGGTPDVPDAAPDAGPEAAVDAADAADAVDAADVTADAPRDATDAGDGGLVCPPVTEPPEPGGVCDGRGQIACQMWAQSLTEAGMARVVCLSTTGGGCARADACRDASDRSTCTCGSGPACPTGQVCVSANAGELPSCRCARPR